MLKLDDVTLYFDLTIALKSINLSIEGNTVTAVTGPSGCGKSTLLHVVAGLLAPDSGTVQVGDVRVSEISEKRRSRWRLKHCGFVFQMAELIPELSLADNVALPLQGLRRPRSEVRTAVLDVLAALEIDGLADSVPSQVSGGQAQRAAVARALVHGPSVVLADEPTGALDQSAGGKVLELFLRAANERGATVLLATHERRLADAADTEIRMLDGRVHG